MPNVSPSRYPFDLQSITPNGGNYYVLVMGRMGRNLGRNVKIFAPPHKPLKTLLFISYFIIWGAMFNKYILYI